MFIGDFPESWSQATLEGMMLVGRLGVNKHGGRRGSAPHQISLRCEVPTPPVCEGQSTATFKPHNIKHRIPEAPKQEGRRALRWGSRF